MTFEDKVVWVLLMVLVAIVLYDVCQLPTDS
jgi:hypothetical protein